MGLLMCNLDHPRSCSSVHVIHFFYICRFTNWMYGGDQLVYQLPANPSMYLELLEPNDEWTLTNTSVHADMFSITLDGFQFDIPQVRESTTCA